MATVVLVGTLNTKGEEYAFLSDRIREHGVDVVLVDAGIVGDPGIRIEPAWKISLVYGLPCAIYHQLPAAYYLATRFVDDFESAILHAINGGGQNMSRAFLTGAMVGAQVGLSKIPPRFVAGLENAEELVRLALELGELAEAG